MRVRGGTSLRAALARAVGVTATVALLAPAAAAAETLSSGDAVKRECAARALPPGTAGVASSAWSAPAEGLLSARLDAGPAPDWDLALLRNGEPAGASTSFGSIEQATIAVRAGDQVVAQACRRTGSAEEAALELDLFETAGIDPPAGRASLESVAISGPGDVARLEQLGVDVTHDVSGRAATVALYDDGQRALLSSAGFETTTLIEDLAAEDRSERRAESRAVTAPRVSPLPTGREAYRVYEDYTTELKDLAEDNPGLVRPQVLGLSFEGRPIEGIEIAADVNRADDGRPVYLNFGTHHAREWPSGEFPMELAHTLVQGFNASDARIVDLLADVRVVIVPVVNPDGFIASRSFGTSPLDDDPIATLPQVVSNQAAYIRKNCRPTDPAQASLPCALRTGSGVDLNRNYGYYWGGPGSSTDTTTQSYRGTGPFSEPESQAVHAFSSGVHPTVFITNHTFTFETGGWLRQPGFDGAFLPQGPDGAITPDEPAMKALGDAMGDTGVDDPTLGATGWPSDLGWESGDITGATEDWNYFAQGTYGYTPEARGPNFHATYADMVVTEYIGDASHPGEGVREAFLLAGEEAANTANHGVLEGTVPPGATLTLTKQFEAPTFTQPALNVDETLETTLQGPASGNYEWHVMPSDRPQISGGPAPNPGDEEWTMTCQRPGGSVFTDTVEVARGQTVNLDWGTACGADPPGNTPPVAAFDVFPIAPEAGQQVNLTSTSSDPDGAIAATNWDLDDDGAFDDASGLVATTTFPAAGSFDVAVEVTDNEGATDTELKTIVVGAASNAPPVAGFDYTPPNPAAGKNVVFDSTSTDPDGSVAALEWDFDGDGLFDDGSGGEVTRSFPADGSYPVTLRATDDDGGTDTQTRSVQVGPLAPPAGTCRGEPATVVGGAGGENLTGTPGDDVIAGFAGRDRILGLGGDDVICGGRGGDRVLGGAGDDVLRGNRGPDRIGGGPGRDDCGGGKGRDRLRSCP